MLKKGEIKPNLSVLPLGDMLQGILYVSQSFRIYILPVYI